MIALNLEVPKWSWHGISYPKSPWELPPCEKFGFTGTDIDLIHSHIETFHGSSEETTTHITLVDTGIEAQPVYFKRIKQNFDGLVLDNAGNIEVEESDDEYEEKENAEKLLADDEYAYSTIKKKKENQDVCGPKQ